MKKKRESTTHAIPRISKVYLSFNITNFQIYEKKLQVWGMVWSCFKKNIFDYETRSCHITGLYHAIFCIGLVHAKLEDFAFSEADEA
jgi:hypothetical protein